MTKRNVKIDVSGWSQGYDTSGHVDYSEIAIAVSGKYSEVEVTLIVRDSDIKALEKAIRCVESNDKEMQSVYDRN